MLYKEDSIINNERPNLRRNNNGDDLVNGDIRFPQVRVIGPNGDQLGIMPRARALQVAETYSLDLVCVAKEANPPVCKILNYGKYRFEMQKKLHDMKKAQKAKEISVKEIQLSPVIGIHDFDTRVKHAQKFLQSGDKVKVTMRFRGRQLSHTEVGLEVVNRFIQAVEEIANVEKQPKLEGKILYCVLASKIKK
ncbi:MAG: translation initiation factor IF-3 [Erysipelotrichaceae bacterium]|nr:translation initiation factor IF-3 [Erysipelotrichaceae bacterium]